MVFAQQFDKESRRARSKPVAVEPSVLHGIEQTERIENIRRGPGEVIAVILLLQ